MIYIRKFLLAFIIDCLDLRRYTQKGQALFSGWLGQRGYLLTFLVVYICRKYTASWGNVIVNPVQIKEKINENDRGGDGKCQFFSLI